jgi:3-oxoacyl-[acyl-carrier-protein] synthase III
MAASVRITGLGSSVPETVVTNEDLAKLVDTSDEWIVKRTGIHTRHIADNETAVSMGTDAAQKALRQAGIAPSDIGLIVACTITSDTVTPSLACDIQKELGIANCAALDVSAGCTGFIYAIVTAMGLMETLGCEHALVIASELMSQVTDWQDRSTCVLFGDGAGAVVLGKSETPGIICPILCAVPDMSNSVYLKREFKQTPFMSQKVDLSPQYLKMEGKEVFTFATDAMEKTLLAMKEQCKDRPFTKIIPHQANYKIIDYVIRNADFSKEQFFIDIGEYANTSSSTIPIAMKDAYDRGWLVKGDRVALVGFGAGLTYGGVVIDFDL